MSISIGDAVLKITADDKDVDKKFDDLDKKTKEAAQKWERNLRIIGAAMVGVGTGLIAALVKSTEAAAQEQAGIERLRISLNNVGIAYEGANGALEKWIDSQQQSTAFADDQQREALSNLVVATGDLTEAQDLLTLSMDLARWKGMDLSSAAGIIQKVYAGNMGILSRYGIIVDENATKEEALAAIQKKAAGQAAAYAKTAAGQMELLKNNIGDISEAIGATLLDNLTGLLKTVNEVIQAIKEWISKNPELTTGLTIFVGILGLALVGLGTFIALKAGVLAAGIVMGAGFTAALGPIGLIILAIAAVIAIGVLLVQNWQKIVDFFTGAEREKTKVTKEELEKQVKLQKEANAKQLSEATASSSKSKEALKKHYGVIEGYAKQENKTLMDLARDASEAREKAIDRDMDAERDAHDERMRMIDEEYDAKIDTLDAETNAAISGLEGQISSLDAAQAAEDKAQEDRENAIKKAELEEAVANAKTAQERMDAQEELQDFLEEQERERIRDSRETQKDALRQQIQAIRDNASLQRDQLQKEYEEKKDHENSLYSAVKDRLQAEKDGLDDALKAELVRLEEERQAYENNEDMKLAKLKQSIEEQDAALQAFHDRELARIEKGTYTTSSQPISGAGPLSGSTGLSWWDQFVQEMNQRYAIPSFAGFEGVIPGIPGTPILATVHAGERISQGGGNTVNIINPSVRSDADITQITRQVTKEMERMRQLRA
ncbi:MAG: phage tail tape measure protein [Dehalococcoidia bacterium]|nr:phage tail tape measure protein [Dehalococcoidia bacterium]